MGKIPSIKMILLKKAKADLEGYITLKISIAGEKLPVRRSTKYKVPVSYWDQNNEIVTRGFLDWDKINDEIAKEKKKVKKLFEQDLEDDIEFTREYVLERIAPTKDSSDFLSVAKVVIDSKKPATRKRYTFELDKLHAYTRGKLNFGTITPKWLTTYYEYLTGPKQGNSHNTAINAFKVIRLVFNKAKKDKITKSYPFKDWEYPVYDKPKPKYLTMAECEELFKILDKDYGEDIKLVTAFFLLECFASLRFGDWGRFSTETILINEDMILTTKKTDTPVRIPIDIMPSLQRIMNYIKANKLKWTRDVGFANDTLKTIKEIAKIDKHMTTHLARHTFATMWLSKGLSRAAIGQMMGITEKQVATYAHLTPEKVRNEVERVGGF
jgi:site-specific recombinase XerD